MTMQRLLISLITLIVISLPARAADFDWMTRFNLRITEGGDTFISRLADDLGVTEATLRIIADKTGTYADAYVAVQLGNMTDRPADQVADLYNSQPGMGWGALAQQLGIKPGSREFKRLKKGRGLPKMKAKRQGFSSPYRPGRDDDDDGY